MLEDVISSDENSAWFFQLSLECRLWPYWLFSRRPAAQVSSASLCIPLYNPDGCCRGCWVTSSTTLLSPGSPWGWRSSTVPAWHWSTGTTPHPGINPYDIGGCLCTRFGSHSMQGCIVSCTPISLGMTSSWNPCSMIWLNLLANMVVVEFIMEHFHPWLSTSSRKISALLKLYYHHQSVSLTMGLGWLILKCPWTQDLCAPKLSIPPWHFMSLKSVFLLLDSFSSKTGEPYLPLQRLLPPSQSLRMSFSSTWSAVKSKVSTN